MILAFHQADFNRLEYRNIAPRLVKESFSVLAIVLASKHKDVAGVLAFSPGEYFDGNPSVRAAAKQVTVPVFITSRGEKEKVIAKLIFDEVSSKDKTQFVPKGEGVHGSSALLQPNGKSDEYWQAVDAFLAKFR